MKDKNKKNFVDGDTVSTFDVYGIVRKIVESNPDDDYYELKDKVHDAIKAEYNYLEWVLNG